MFYLLKLISLTLPFIPLSISFTLFYCLLFNVWGSFIFLYLLLYVRNNLSMRNRYECRESSRRRSELSRADLLWVLFSFFLFDRAHICVYTHIYTRESTFASVSTIPSFSQSCRRYFPGLDIILSRSLSKWARPWLYSDIQRNTFVIPDSYSYI